MLKNKFSYCLIVLLILILLKVYYIYLFKSFGDDATVEVQEVNILSKIPVKRLANITAMLNKEMKAIEVKVLPSTIEKVSEVKVEYGSKEDEEVAVSIIGLEKFKQFINEHSSVLVMFYAMHCYWSRMALPEFNAAAQMLSHHVPPVALVKIDADANDEILKEYSITEYPTFRFFMEGEPHNYTGMNRYRTTLVHWVDNKLNRDSAINSVAHLSTLMNNFNEGHNIVVGAFPNLVNASDFSHVAREHADDTFFAKIHQNDIIKYFITEYLNKKMNTSENLEPPFIVMFDHYENVVEVYRQSLNDRNAIEEFVKKHEFPVAVKFDNDWATKLFSDGRAICILILNSITNSNSEQKNDGYIELFKKVAKIYRGVLLFTISGNFENSEKRLIKLLGAEESLLPAIRIIAYDSNAQNHIHKALKYKYTPSTDGNIDEKILRRFIDAFNRREIQPYLNSEAIPENDSADGPIKVVVGLTFDNIVRKSDKHVFIVIFAPWCGHCRKLEPALKELALRMSGVKNVIIGKIDATRNEIKNLYFSGFPTLYLFKKDRKDHPLQYEGNRSVKDMMNFIVEMCELNLNVDELMDMDLKSRRDGNQIDDELTFEEL